MYNNGNNRFYLNVSIYDKTGLGNLSSAVQKNITLQILSLKLIKRHLNNKESLSQT